MFSAIADIEYSLPDEYESNEDLIQNFPEWTVEKIARKTGITKRHIAAHNETASDLAYRAAHSLLEKHPEVTKEIDLLLFCTQTPDYALPTTACVLQDRLGLATSCLSLDYNLGCSGYVVGLSLANALLQANEAKKALLLTGETYSKWISPVDKSSRTIFGDAGTATLLTSSQEKKIGPFVYGSDGKGKDNLIVYGSGARKISVNDRIEKIPTTHPVDALYMDGAEIFSFTIRTVPQSVSDLLQKSELAIDDIDWFVFHQANSFMLEHLRVQCKIPKEKFIISLEDTGNTVSNSIPIVLCKMIKDKKIIHGQKAMLVGFGVGYSWSACIIELE